MRESSAPCQPPSSPVLNPAHKGQWRQVDQRLAWPGPVELRRPMYCCEVGSTFNGEPCTHPNGPQQGGAIRQPHWSCCGQTRSDAPCVPVAALSRRADGGGGGGGDGRGGDLDEHEVGAVVQALADMGIECTRDGARRALLYNLERGVASPETRKLNAVAWLVDHPTA